MGSHAKHLDVSDWQTTDFFFDESLVDDPYPYFEQLRADIDTLLKKPAGGE